MSEEKKKFFGADRFALRKSQVFGVAVVMLFCLGIVLMPGEKLGRLLMGEGGTTARHLGNALFRAVGLAAIVLLACDLGFKIFGFGGRAKGFLLSLPFLAVAINNLPIVGLARGEVSVSGSGASVSVFIFYCLSVGFFEETVFRGIILPLILDKAPRTRKWVFLSLVISSALFGAVHLVNLLSSAPLPVIAQVGYSFLIGLMCGMVLLLTRNIIACSFLHALFDFCGLLADELGTGVLWDGASIALTAVVGVAALGYGIWLMLRRTDCAVAAALWINR